MKNLLMFKETEQNQSFIGFIFVYGYFPKNFTHFIP